MDDATLQVGEASIGGWSELQLDPIAEAHEPTIGALSEHPGRPLWLELPSNTPFYVIRKLLNSADRAESGAIFLSTEGSDRAFEVVDPPSYGLGGVCPEGPLAVHGTLPLITLSLQTGRDGTWLVGSARFLPVVDRRGERGAVDGLPERCLSNPGCDQLFADTPALAAACREGQAGSAPERVLLGGSNGCLLPIASSAGSLDRWRAELPAQIAALGLREQPLLMVMPEAQIQLDALLTVLGGLAPRTPAVGATLLIQGNDGPPVCNAPVRSRDDLAQAGARWLGSLTQREE